MSYLVTVTGHEPSPTAAPNWLVALGNVLDELGIDANIERMGCETLPNGTVIARDLSGGKSFVIKPAGDFDAPDLPTSESTPFAIGNLPQSVLLGHMGHVLRTPLNAVLGYSDLLREVALDEGAAMMVKDLERINLAGQQLADIVEALMDAWKVEAGEVVPTSERFDLASMLRDVADAIEPAVAREHLQLLFDCPPDIGKIQCDPAILRSALTLSLVRAVSRSVGQVDLKAYRRPGEVIIHIRDDGPDLTDEELHRAFEVFGETTVGAVERAADTIRLATTRALVQAMGGGMVLANRNSRGTRITVALRG